MPLKNHHLHPLLLALPGLFTASLALAQEQNLQTVDVRGKLISDVTTAVSSEDVQTRAARSLGARLGS